ncbi:MAG: GNAT family N-acetyltransferase [Pseudomonadota bacterium]|nr:GNAT family N-acetyltransferase [Pseudomonadota bacterium]
MNTIRTNELTPRAGYQSDAKRCAQIVHSWIEKTEWMPDLYTLTELQKMIEASIPFRKFWVIGTPIQGYVSFNEENSQVVALYVDEPGNGRGVALLEKVKEEQEYLQLWSHSPNVRAHRFYLREGFTRSGLRRDGEDGIKEVQFTWSR